jgi:thiol-disulfide isomerase/thioredoxin
MWLLVISTVAFAGEQPPSVPEILEHEFTVVTTEGDSVSLAELFDPSRPVIVEFWTTWCVPCRKTFPHLVDLKKEYGDRLVVLGLTVEDPEEDLVKVRKFVEEHGVNFPIAFAPDELYEFMNRRTDIAVPKLFVFDGDGSLVTYIPRHSPLTTSKLKSAVARAVRGRGSR